MARPKNFKRTSPAFKEEMRKAIKHALRIQLEPQKYGGNYVSEGFVVKLLDKDMKAEELKLVLETYCRQRVPADFEYF